MDQERRNAQRITFETSATLTYGAKETLTAEVETSNISLKGIFITTQTKIPLNTECSIMVHLKGNSSLMHFSATGVVCRHESEGFAIAFSEVNTDCYAHITNLINLNKSSV